MPDPFEKKGSKETQEASATDTVRAKVWGRGKTEKETTRKNLPQLSHRHRTDFFQRNKTSKFLLCLRGKTINKTPKSQ